MSRDEIRRLVLGAIGKVAPELDLDKIDPRANIRDQYDLDSVDFMNILVAIHAQTGVDIPEADYRKLGTLDDCVEYLARALHENTTPADPSIAPSGSTRGAR
jgi:acyl carrier protein